MTRLKETVYRLSPGHRTACVYWCLVTLCSPTLSADPKRMETYRIGCIQRYKRTGWLSISETRNFWKER